LAEESKNLAASETSQDSNWALLTTHTIQ
jgi:hypothetical protein